MKYTLFPFFEESEPVYTQKELAEFENRKVTYNGEEMTEYDATQKQRAMERRIRSTKRELAGYDAGINTTDNDSLKADLQAAFDRKSVLLKKQEAALKDFTKQTGLIRDRSREQVSAHFDTTKGKVVSFNKSVSQKAVITAKGSLRNTQNNGAFAVLPERMTKKHVREIAKSAGIDLHSIKIRIDKNEELLRIPFAGRADYEEIGSITLFPNAFRSKEELTRTVYHEIIHVNQFRDYGIEYVQNNRAFFEKITYEQEKQFIKKLKESGVL